MNERAVFAFAMPEISRALRRGDHADAIRRLQVSWLCAGENPADARTLALRSWTALFNTEPARPRR